jgi:hypothetical protein
MRGRRLEAEPRFTFHASRFTVLEAGLERRRWPRIVHHNRTAMSDRLLDATLEEQDEQH